MFLNELQNLDIYIKYVDKYQNWWNKRPRSFFQV